MLLRKKSVVILSSVVFIACLATGFRQSYHKPLWNDEIYTLVSSVSRLSYSDILLGRVGEGNNSPLFYLIQKVMCSVGQYTIPEPWLHSDWGHKDLYSQIFLRLNSVVFMALSITMIFYYFCRRYSLLAGMYSLAVSLSSFMVWSYWAEARPYALWVFLTTLQSVIFLNIMRSEGKRETEFAWLTVTHILLALSSAISVIQITIVSFLVWAILTRDWKKYVLLFFVPAITCVGYYMLAPKYEFWFKEGPLMLINASIPKDRFLIFFAFMIYCGLSILKAKVPLLRTLSMNTLEGGGRREALAYFWLMALTIIGAVFILLKFKLGESPVGQGFQISNRYFINLTPVGIIATTLFSIHLVKSPRNRLAQGIILLLLVGLLAIRIFRTIQLI